jgi:hypothetical protein
MPGLRQVGSLDVGVAAKDADVAKRLPAGSRVTG